MLNGEIKQDGFNRAGGHGSWVATVASIMIPVVCNIRGHVLRTVASWTCV